MLNNLSAIAGPSLLFVAVLGGIYLMLPSLMGLPESVQAILINAVYVFIAVGLAASVRFKRNREFVILLSLSLAYLAYDVFVSRDVQGGNWQYRLFVLHDALWQYRYDLDSGRLDLSAEFVHLAICFFLPLNLFLAQLFRPSGQLGRQAILMLALLLLEVACTWFLIDSSQVLLHQLISRPLIMGTWPQQSAVPQLAILFMLLLLATSFWQLANGRARLDFIGAFLAVVLACALSTNKLPFALFVSLAAISLTVAMLRRLSSQAYIDELTQVASRRKLVEDAEGLRPPYSVAMVDVDHFKSFNDTHGHKVGDQVLKMVAGQLQRGIRKGQVYRYGGEEFTLLFPRAQLEDVRSEMEYVRQLIQDYPFVVRKRNPLKRAVPNPQTPESEQHVRVTVSIGGAQSFEDATLDQVIEMADHALYQAKNNGRNRVEYAN